MTEVVALPPSIPTRARWPLSLVVGLILTAGVIATALIALVWTPYDPAAVDIAAKLTAQSAAHWMGTDHFGRDVLSMIMAGAQNSLIVALVAVGVGAGVCVLSGAAPGSGCVAATVPQAHSSSAPSNL